jgi:hypothetical protein
MAKQLKQKIRHKAWNRLINGNLLSRLPPDKAGLFVIKRLPVQYL